MKYIIGFDTIEQEIEFDINLKVKYYNGNPVKVLSTHFTGNFTTVTDGDKKWEVLTKDLKDG